MTLALITGLLLLAVAVTAIARAIGGARLGHVRTLDQIGAYGYTVDVGEDTAGASHGALDRLAARLGEYAAKRLKSLDEVELRKRLLSAGLYDLSPRKLVGYQVLAAIGFPVIFGWLAIGSGNAKLGILFIVVGTYFGWRLPMIVVQRIARRRLEQIEYELPELIDLLVVTVEAGLGLAGSLRVAAIRLDGPLGQELRLTLQEQTLGLSTTEALTNLVERADTPSMRTFVRSIVQGETLGVSIGQIMRNLAVEMRKRRRQSAEERAQKAPVKMLFPLVFLIFPAMFIVLLTPGIITFVKLFGGK
jgi:tight adherence protein C